MSRAVITDLFLFASTAYIAVKALGAKMGKNSDLQPSILSEKALLEGKTLSADELVCTVDENNVPTEHGHPRHLMRLHKMWHRATYIVVRHEDQGDDNSCDKMIVQRRSKLKDYCPGKLDPTPGGVVGFGEAFQLNVTRELDEEMGITEENSHNLQRLFTFNYRDDDVKCWGDLWEVTYTGRLEHLKLQEEEVDEVFSLSFEDVKQMAVDNPSDWMPDALHALKLYLQYHHDSKVQRRKFICSSVGKSACGDLDSYKLRPKIEAIFFDCDDCLYFDEWTIANMLTAKIESWFSERGHPKGYAYELYKTYGTALKGLQAEKLIEDTEDAIDSYLRDVHDIPISSYLKEDIKLKNILESIDPSIPKYIFTASVKHHAERCLDALGIRDMFVDIIDVKACGLATKHTDQAFESAMRVANISNPSSCLFFDDSLKNIRVGARIGWRCVLVGKVGRDCGNPINSGGAAEHEIDRIHEISNIYPELFESKATT